MQTLLEVKNLKTQFVKKKSTVTAVDDVSFTIEKGKILGIVGESGCGKSVTSLSILGLLPAIGRVADGEILFKGMDLTKLKPSEMSRIRGNEIAMIFQDPLTSLNPVLTVGRQLSESFIIHQNLSKKEALEKSINMLRRVGIPSPELRIRSYPHQLSGGMRQRVMIAMALSCNPELLIADEPTTALDVTIQAQILKLMRDLSADMGTAIMLITHDLGVVAEMADNILVMYAGQVVEYADAETIFTHPQHPYTSGLLQSIPRLEEQAERLYSIDGAVPDIQNMPKGCRFAPRCPYADDSCHVQRPELRSTEHGFVRCLKNIGGEKK